MKNFIRRFIQKFKKIQTPEKIYPFKEVCLLEDTHTFKKINFIGKKVIIRGDRSGVFFGTLEGRKGQEIMLSNCRRLWYWEGACSISQIAIDGVTRPEDCKFTIIVPEIEILDCVEIIPCTEKSITSINGVATWKS